MVSCLSAVLSGPRSLREKFPWCARTVVEPSASPGSPHGIRCTSMRTRYKDSFLPRRRFTMHAMGVCICIAQASHLANNPAYAADEVPRAPEQEIVIVGTALLPNSEVPLDEVPANVQQVGADRLNHEKPLNISAALNKMVGSV